MYLYWESGPISEMSFLLPNRICMYNNGILFHFYLFFKDGKASLIPSNFGSYILEIGSFSFFYLIYWIHIAYIYIQYLISKFWNIIISVRINTQCFFFYFIIYSTQYSTFIIWWVVFKVHLSKEGHPIYLVHCVLPSLINRIFFEYAHQTHEFWCEEFE